MVMNMIMMVLVEEFSILSGYSGLIVEYFEVASSEAFTGHVKFGFINEMQMLISAIFKKFTEQGMKLR